MKAHILQLRQLPSSDDQLDLAYGHYMLCDSCTDRKLCPEGLEMYFLGFALMCPLTRPLRQRVSVERRRSSS